MQRRRAELLLNGQLVGVLYVVASLAELGYFLWQKNLTFCGWDWLLFCLLRGKVGLPSGSWMPNDLGVICLHGGGVLLASRRLEAYAAWRVISRLGIDDSIRRLPWLLRSRRCS